MAKLKASLAVEGQSLSLAFLGSKLFALLWKLWFLMPREGSGESETVSFSLNGGRVATPPPRGGRGVSGEGPAGTAWPQSGSGCFTGLFRPAEGSSLAA